MPTAKLVYLPVSPFSERARWALDHKVFPYEKERYTVIDGEDDLAKLTGQRQVPVLIAGAEIIPDSTAILEWLEDRVPEPPLMPRDPALRAQTMLYDVGGRPRPRKFERRRRAARRMAYARRPWTGRGARFLARSAGVRPSISCCTRGSVIPRMRIAATAG